MMFGKEKFILKKQIVKHYRPILYPPEITYFIESDVA